jgi:hypothetical protein
MVSFAAKEQLAIIGQPDKGKLESPRYKLESRERQVERDEEWEE